MTRGPLAADRVLSAQSPACFPDRGQAAPWRRDKRFSWTCLSYTPVQSQLTLVTSQASGPRAKPPQQTC